STGVIRAQLVWSSEADLDLDLTLPSGQEVFFANVSVTFNNGNAIATLDHDNLGNTIDFPPNIRVENIAVNGIPLGGLYRFLVTNFNSPNVTDTFTLTVSYNGQTQVITGTLAPGQSSTTVVVQVPGAVRQLREFSVAAAASIYRATGIRPDQQRAISRP